MTFDWSISLGVIVHLVVLVTTLVSSAIGLVRHFDRRINRVEEELHRRIGNGNATPLGQRIALLDTKVSEMWRWFMERAGT